MQCAKSNVVYDLKFIWILSTEKEHWNILIIECKSLSSNWEKVSAYLGLSFELIDTIKRDNPRDSTGCWNEALKEWIKQNYNTKKFGRPSWRSLLRAVAEVDKRQFQKLAAEHQGEKLICDRIWESPLYGIFQKIEFAAWLISSII